MDENKNNALTEEQLEQISGGGGTANDGNCGRTVLLSNGSCRSKIAGMNSVDNPCSSCKYAN